MLSRRYYERLRSRFNDWENERRLQAAVAGSWSSTSADTLDAMLNALSAGSTALMDELLKPVERAKMAMVRYRKRRMVLDEVATRILARPPAGSVRQTRTRRRRLIALVFLVSGIAWKRARRSLEYTAINARHTLSNAFGRTKLCDSFFERFGGNRLHLRSWIMDFLATPWRSNWILVSSSVLQADWFLL